jgi:hypothetical protein
VDKIGEKSGKSVWKDSLGGQRGADRWPVGAPPILANLRSDGDVCRRAKGPKRHKPTRALARDGVEGDVVGSVSGLGLELRPVEGGVAHRRVYALIPSL